MRKFVAGFVGIAMTLSLVGSVASSADAQTAGASATFTRDLTVGSSGSDVAALQGILVAGGYLVMPAGVAPGYFGELTRAAVAKWQMSAGISPAAGYFGPISRAKLAGTVVPTTSGTPVAGCPAGALFNTMTGKPCTSTAPTSTATPSGDLEGGAGSIEDTTLISSLNNEEVGEDEEDVEVAGLEVEVDDGSDIEITAVRLVFDEGTGATSDFEDYAAEVSIWLDGEEFARVDADDFNDDNDWTKTVSLEEGAIIRAGETGDLTVAITGASNLDTNDKGDEWDVDFTTIRFKDADGASISETIIETERTFSFEGFATAAGTELKFTSGDDAVNDPRAIDVHATEDTDDVEIFSFSIEVEGDADVTIDSLPMEFTVTGAGHIDELFTSATLLMDGEEVGSENIPTDDETLVFDDLDLTLEAGSTYDFTVEVDLLAVSGDLDNGDTFSVAIGETETDSASFDAEDEVGEDLVDADVTGTASAGAHAVFDVGINLKLVSVEEEAVDNDQASDNDVGIFTMVFDITAFGGTVYVGDTADATTVDPVGGGAVTDAIVYRVYDSGTATTDDLADLVTFTTPSGVTDSTDNIAIQEGKTSRVTLTVTQTNNTTEDDGIYYMELGGVAWGIADDTTYEFMYKFNLDDFETSTVTLN